MTRLSIKEIFTKSNISFIIGIIGFISAIFSMFFDWNQSLKFKWFGLWTILLGIIILLLLLLLSKVKEIRNENIKELQTKLDESIANYQRLINIEIKAIKFSPKESILLVEKNPRFEERQFVSIDYKLDEFHIPFAVGYVSSVQNNSIQIKITEVDTNFETKYPDEIKKISENHKDSLNSLLIKKYYKYDN